MPRSMSCRHGVISNNFLSRLPPRFYLGIFSLADDGLASYPRELFFSGHLLAALSRHAPQIKHNSKLVTTCICVPTATDTLRGVCMLRRPSEDRKKTACPSLSLQQPCRPKALTRKEMGGERSLKAAKRRLSRSKRSKTVSPNQISSEGSLLRTLVSLSSSIRLNE
jgi:hypothetical protein